MPDYEYVVVDVISITNGKLLLLEKRGEFWILPGGKREKGESDLECIVRELSQEQPGGKLIGETTFFCEFYGLSPSGKKIKVLCYFGRVEGDTSPGAEITDARRVSGDKLLSYPLSAIMRSIAQKLLDEKYI
jgi:ADP-ribose pyrophosphatase YjhB (NUDIX family)